MEANSHYPNAFASSGSDAKEQFSDNRKQMSNPPQAPLFRSTKSATKVSPPPKAMRRVSMPMLSSTFPPFTKQQDHYSNLRSDTFDTTVASASSPSFPYPSTMFPHEDVTFLNPTVPFPHQSYTRTVTTNTLFPEKISRIPTLSSSLASSTTQHKAYLCKESNEASLPVPTSDLNVTRSAALLGTIKTGVASTCEVSDTDQQLQHHWAQHLELEDDDHNVVSGAHDVEYGNHFGNSFPGFNIHDDDLFKEETLDDTSECNPDEEKVLAKKLMILSQKNRESSRQLRKMQAIIDQQKKQRQLQEQILSTLDMASSAQKNISQDVGMRRRKFQRQMTTPILPNSQVPSLSMRLNDIDHCQFQQQHLQRRHTLGVVSEVNEDDDDWILYQAYLQNAAALNNAMPNISERSAAYSHNSQRFPPSILPISKHHSREAMRKYGNMHPPLGSNQRFQLSANDYYLQMMQQHQWHQQQLLFGNSSTASVQQSQQPLLVGKTIAFRDQKARNQKSESSHDDHDDTISAITMPPELSSLSGKTVASAASAAPQNQQYHGWFNNANTGER